MTNKPLTEKKTSWINSTLWSAEHLFGKSSASETELLKAAKPGRGKGG